MNSARKVNKRQKWYISHEILYFVTKPSRSEQREKSLVWENLILLNARNAEDAYRKAMKLGQLNEQKVRIGEKEGFLRFKGLRDLVAIHDELKNGAELEWREFRIDAAKLKAMITPKRRLHAFRSAGG